MEINEDEFKKLEKKFEESKTFLERAKKIEEYQKTIDEAEALRKKLYPTGNEKFMKTISKLAGGNKDG